MMLEPTTALAMLTRELERALHSGPSAAVTPYRPAAAGIRRSETEAAWQVEIDLPGVAPDSLEVQADAEQLDVVGTRTRADAEPEEVRRTFLLPPAGGEVSASYAHGVLTVTVAKPELAQRRTIEVTTG